MGFRCINHQISHAKTITAPFTPWHEWATHAAELVLSFVCRALLALSQVSLKGYSFHSPRQMQSQAVSPLQESRLRDSLGYIRQLRPQRGQLMNVVTTVPRPRSPPRHSVLVGGSFATLIILLKSEISFASPRVSSAEPSALWSGAHAVKWRIPDLCLSVLIRAKSLNLPFNALEVEGLIYWNIWGRRCSHPSSGHCVIALNFRLLLQQPICVDKSHWLWRICNIKVKNDFYAMWTSQSYF